MKIQSQKEKDDLEQSNGTLSVDLADKEKQIRMAISGIGMEGCGMKDNDENDRWTMNRWNDEAVSDEMIGERWEGTNEGDKWNRDGKIPRVGSNGRGNENAPKRKKNGAT